MIDSEGVRAALDAGAGAVVVKSTNESEAARHQLGFTEYGLFDSHWRRLKWDFDPPADASLLNRSGLHPADLATWIDQVATLVTEQGSSYVIPSVIPADRNHAPGLVARIVRETGCSAVEVNIGAPHGAEAPPGTIALERDTAVITQLIRSIRVVTDVPLWIKLTGQSDAVPAMSKAAFSAGADAVTLVTRHMAMLPDLDTQGPTFGTVLGFGGGWALPITCRWLALTRKLLGENRCLMATNGARSGADVARFLLAGASAAQMSSAVFTSGYDTLTNAVSDLDAYLEARNQSASEIIGLASDRLSGYTDQHLDPDHWREFLPPTS